MYDNLIIMPNDPPALVELLYDEPKSYPSKKPTAKPGELNYRFSFRMLAAYAGSKSMYPAGAEVTYWADNLKHVMELQAFRRGAQLKITKFKTPEMRWAGTKVEAMAGVAAPTAPVLYSEARSLDPQNAATTILGLVPHDAQPEAPQPEAQAPQPTGRNMKDALVEAFASVVEGTKEIAELYGAERAKQFEDTLLQGDQLQKIGVTIYMRRP